MIFVVQPDHVRKQALIISNSNYSLPQNQLVDSNNNIDRLAQTLRDIDFDVTVHEDLVNEDKTMDEVITFARRVKNGDIVLCYLSGHAVVVDGENYFIPVDDIKIHNDDGIQASGVYVKRFLDRLIENKPNSMFLLLFDTCRSYVIGPKSRSECEYGIQ